MQETPTAVAESHDTYAASPIDRGSLRLLLVSEECFLCEALADILERDACVTSVRYADVADAISQSLAAEVDAILLCVPMLDNIDAVKRLRRIAPSIPVIACALKETEANVIAWVEAGATGYIPSTTRLSEFVGALRQILAGEQLSSPRIVAGLLNRFAAAGLTEINSAGPAPQLTRRERQIAELIAAGRTDKEIARGLNISLATAKFHVHNLLRKLHVPHRNHVVHAIPWFLSRSNREETGSYRLPSDHSKIASHLC